MDKQGSSSKNLSGKDELKRIEENYKALFKSDLGKLVLEDLKKSLGYGRTLYIEKSTNLDLAFHQGRQSVINDIVHILSK